MPRVKHHKFEDYALDTLARYERDKPEIIAVDTETTGLTWQDSPFGMSVSWQGPERVEHGYFEVEEEVPFKLAQRLLDFHHMRGGSLYNEDTVFVFFNAKFDLRMLHNFGLIVDTESLDYIDVMPMVALLDPMGEHKLKAAARKYLGVNTNEAAMVAQARHELGLKKENGYWPLPREVVVPYALKDTDFTLALYHKLWPLIQERGLQVPFDKDMRLVAEMLRMEQRGLLTDPDVVKAEIKVCDKRIEKAKTHIEGLTGRVVGDKTRKERVEIGLSPKTGRMLHKTIEVPDDLNLNSWQQLIAVFKERGVNLKSTENEVLAKCEDELAQYIVAYRSEYKLRNTYLIPLLKEADENNILHPNFNQWGTGTGRFSSSATRET